MLDNIKNNEADDEKVLLLSAKGVVKLVCIMAYREFEKTPRSRARKMLNLIMTTARQNGMESVKAFSDFIGNSWIKSKELDEFIDEIFHYVTDVQVIGFMEYIRHEK